MECWVNENKKNKVYKYSWYCKYSNNICYSISPNFKTIKETFHAAYVLLKHYDDLCYVAFRDIKKLPNNHPFYLDGFTKDVKNINKWEKHKFLMNKYPNFDINDYKEFWNNNDNDKIEKFEDIELWHY